MQFIYFQLGIVSTYIYFQFVIVSTLQFIHFQFGIVSTLSVWCCVNITIYSLSVNPKLVILFFFTVIVITKKNAVPQGNTWASLLSTCDFHRKMNKIQNKQNVAKRKTTWG
jgi:hypothetical protein